MASRLRASLPSPAWVESVVDFGHARNKSSRTTDVFPSILVFRKPMADTPPSDDAVCAIPRDQLRLDDP